MFLGSLTKPALRGTWAIVEVWATWGKRAAAAGRQRWKVETGDEVQTGRENGWRPTSWMGDWGRWWWGTAGTLTSGWATWTGWWTWTGWGMGMCWGMWMGWMIWWTWTGAGATVVVVVVAGLVVVVVVLRVVAGRAGSVGLGGGGR